MRKGRVDPKREESAPRVRKARSRGWGAVIGGGRHQPDVQISRLGELGQKLRVAGRLQARLCGGKSGRKMRVLKASAPRFARDDHGRLGLANQGDLRARFPGPRRFPLGSGRSGGCRGERRIARGEYVRLRGARVDARNERQSDRAEEGQSSYTAKMPHRPEIDPRIRIRQRKPSAALIRSRGCPTTHFRKSSASRSFVRGVGRLAAPRV